MIDRHASRELFTIEQFVTLSAKINYQLSAHSLKKSVLLSLVLGANEARDRAQEKLEELYDTSGSSWEHLKTGAEKAWKELKEALEKAKSEFK